MTHSLIVSHIYDLIMYSCIADMTCCSYNSDLDRNSYSLELDSL